MFLDSSDTSIEDVIDALESLRDLVIQDGDNKVCQIDSPEFRYQLTSHDAERVIYVVKLIRKFLSREPIQEALDELTHSGYKTSFNPDQDDPYRYVGTVQIGDLYLNISEPPNQ